MLKTFVSIILFIKKGKLRLESYYCLLIAKSFDYSERLVNIFNNIKLAHLYLYKTFGENRF